MENLKVQKKWVFQEAELSVKGSLERSACQVDASSNFSTARHDKYRGWKIVKGVAKVTESTGQKTAIESTGEAEEMAE